MTVSSAKLCISTDYLLKQCADYSPFKLLSLKRGLHCTQTDNALICHAHKSSLIVYRDPGF